MVEALIIEPKLAGSIRETLQRMGRATLLTIGVQRDAIDVIQEWVDLLEDKLVAVRHVVALDEDSRAVISESVSGREEVRPVWKRIRADFLFFGWFVPALLVAIIIVFGGAVAYYLPNLTQGLQPTIYGTVADIFGGLLGFVIAGVAILLTMGETARIKLMVESGMYRKVTVIFHSTAKWLAGGTFLALAGLVMDRPNQPQWPYIWLVAGATLIVALRIWRCIWVLEQVVDLVLRDREPRKKRTLPYIPADDDPRRPLD